MMNNKKAVSPLIATVLLIAFAVALGAIVMNWGRTYVTDTQTFAREGSESLVTCSSNVELEANVLKAYVHVKDPTTTNHYVDYVELSLENKGGLDLPQIVVKLYDEESGQGIASVYNYSFSKYTIGKFNFTYNNMVNYSLNITAKVSNATQITVIPFIHIKGREDPMGCENRASVVKASDDEIDYTS